MALVITALGIRLWWPEGPDELVTADGAAQSATVVRTFAERFVGLETCGECHADKVESFSRTAHAESLRVASGAEIWGDFGPDKRVMRTRRSDLWYEVAANERGMFQTSFEGTPQGMVRTTQRADLVMGSGKLALSYLYWHGDKLYQMPLVYFIPLENWTNAPGFSDRFAWWERPITPRCLECHATYFEHVPGTENTYRQDNFIAAISCERCHGRGSEHVAFHRAHPDATRGERIVDPRLLSRERQLDNCSLCHGAVGRPIEPSFSYTAGEPLAKSFRFEGRAADVGLVHTVNQLDRLGQSKCFLQTPSMTCTTCHDPHVAERGDLQKHSNRCLECHDPGSHPAAEKFGPRLATNCIDCHMAFKDDQSLEFKTSTGDKLKLVQLRDHLISVDTARSDEVLHRWRAGAADLTFEQRLREFATTRLATAKAAHAQKLLQAGDQQGARRFLEESVATKPDFAPALTGLGIVLYTAGDEAAARERFEQAIAVDAKYVPALTNLAILEVNAGQFAAAIQRCRTVLEIDPQNSEALFCLANCAAKEGKFAAAIDRFHELLRRTPNHLAAINNLAWLRAACPDAQFRDGAEAIKLAEQLVREPGHATWSAWDTLAAAYAEGGQFEQAVLTAEKALAAARSEAQVSGSRLEQLVSRLNGYRRGEPHREPSPMPEPGN
jgi:tetratricopeptide (TPR) repeat protein